MFSTEKLYFLKLQSARVISTSHIQKILLTIEDKWVVLYFSLQYSFLFFKITINI